MSRSTRFIPLAIMLFLTISCAYAQNAGVSSRDPAWSPDGSQLVFVSDETGNFEIYVIGVDGENCRKVTGGGDAKFYVHFSPDGSALVYLTWRQEGDSTHAGVWTIDVDGSNNVMLSNPHEHTTDGSWASTDGHVRILFDVVRNGNDDIYIMDTDGSNQERLTTNPSREFTPVMSPDGEHIVFVTDRDGPEEIYIMDSDGSNQRNLTNDDLENLVPNWSPDSRRIVYYSQTPDEGSTTDELYILDVRTGEKKRLTHNDVRDFGPRWSPNGSLIAFSSMRSGQLEIHVMDLATGVVRQVTRNGCGAAAVRSVELDTRVELVAPGVISLPERNETFPAVDPRDESLWFSVFDDSFDEQTLMFARWTGADWAEPEVAPFSGTWGDRAPRFSVDGAILYFTSNRPREPGGSSDDMNIWRVRRSAGAWGDPELLPGPLNSEASDIHSSATRRSVWVASRRSGSLGRSDIFRVGGDGRVEHLGPSINDELSQPDLWVSPDESWMILVVTDHPDGHGGDDLFVSRFEGGTWTVPENLGPEINSEEYEYGPTVSPDGEYLYFNSHRRGSADLYRIRLSSVPTLASLSIVPDQEAAELEE